jgi:hypothetical protein
MPERTTLRVLLDENIDHQLVGLFDAEFAVRTVEDQGWKGVTNGELLRAAASTFDVFITMDRHLPYQQNLSALRLAIVVIRSVSNAFVDVAPLMPEVNAAVRTAERGAATIIQHPDL